MQIALDDWQKEVLNYKGDFLLCTGRRVGKTQIMAIKAAERMIAKPKTQIVIASLTEDQAKLIIVMILDYLERNFKKFVAKGKNKPTQSKITLTNGSTALARPVGTTGDGLRGFQGNVLILDEVSRFNEFIMIAATPILLTTGGEIWMCSTPFGKTGYFWKKFNEAYNLKLEDARFKVFYKTSPDVINERAISASWTEKQKAEAIKFLEQEQRDMTAMQYGQEYMGLFMEDLMRFFDDDLLKKCCIVKRAIPNEHSVFFMGNDLARMGGDSFTAEIIKIISKNKYVHVESYSEKKLLTTRNEDLILQFNRTWNPKKIGIDAGAGTLGVSILDHLLQNSEVNRKIIAMNNREIFLDRNEEKKQRMFKEDMYDNLKAMMENNEIDLLDDDKVILSLASVQMELVKDSHDNTKVRIFGTDTHIAEGLIRAAWLAKTEKSLNLRIMFI